MSNVDPRPEIRLTAGEWMARQRAHARRLGPVIDEHLRRQSRHERHPVYDFLFEYYSFRPSHLRLWSPGAGVVLLDGPGVEYPAIPELAEKAGGRWLDPARFSFRRLESLDWIIHLLEQTRARPPRFGCFGLHEWAMVYESDAIRHPAVPLRLAPEAIARFIRGQEIRCSHYDAFRFFTPAARPLNRLQPDRVGQPVLEQRGCLHVNMDLYKWAYKFYPWIPSDLIADAFELAWRAREIDMRASPYDLSAQGFTPIRIETAEGHAEYVNQQIGIAGRAVGVREKLITAYHALRKAVLEIHSGRIHTSDIR
jgi:hypothetical protein